MYNRRIKYNDIDLSRAAIVGISLALTITLAIWINKLKDKLYFKAVQSGKLTEQDIVRHLVTDLYTNITNKLPRDYIMMENERLKKLRDCRTFEDLRRALKYIDINTSEVDDLERIYKEALANRPKRIGVNGKVAYDRKPKGIITHDSMPWAHG